MFGLFSDKKTKLEKTYQRLLKQSFELSHSPSEVREFRSIARYGYKQPPSVPNVFELCLDANVDLTGARTTFFLGRVTLDVTDKSNMFRWRKPLFSWLARLAD